MSRISIDEVDTEGVVKNGYDYELQVWVKEYKVLMCGHPSAMRSTGLLCCNGYLYAEQDIRNIEGHQVRK